MSSFFPIPPESQLPRMLRVKDGLKDGLGRDITYLRVSVTEQCNLACVYCKPRTGSLERAEAPAMSRNEVVQLVKVFTSLGIRKVRLTGGEPLLRRDLETIIAGISPEVEGRVHLTTNGIHLARRARSLRDAGLSGVNVSLDAADRATFERLTGKDGLGRVLAGLEAARAVGLKTKLNAVVLRGWNEDQILQYFPRLRERMDVAADYLSGGEQQMVAVARAMSGNVKLLLLDEPFEGLAPTVILELFKVFDQLRRHTSIVIVEHNLDLVLALADRVFALERGAVFHQGPAAPLLTDLDYRKKILWL